MNTRKLFKFGAILARELDDGTPARTRRRHVCEALHNMNDIIDNGPEFLDADAAQNFKSLAYKIQLNMSWLATMSIRRGLLLWKITPKLHYLTHLAEQAVLCNPRLVRNYRMESGILRSIGGGRERIL